MSIVFPMIPGAEINLLLLILLSFSVGILSGFAGVGGGFLMTPALMILGFPAQFAVGTSLIWVMSNSIVGTLRHRQHGNVDVKLGLIITIASICGVEIGVRVLNWVRNLGLAEATVLIVSIIILLAIGGYMFFESCQSVKQTNRVSRKDTRFNANDANIITARLRWFRLKPVINFPKSGITISFWIVVAIGLFVGTLSGLMGVGGGFIMVPSMIYLLGIPAFLAVGTDLFQIIFSSAYGAIRHTMSGNVIIFVAFIMIFGSAIGVQCGVLGTRILSGTIMKFILSFSILVAILGSLLKLINIFLGNTINWLRPCEIAVTFGGLGLILIMILSLLIVALRFDRGKSIPKWLIPFVARNEL